MKENNNKFKTILDNIFVSSQRFLLSMRNERIAIKTEHFAQ